MKCHTLRTIADEMSRDKRTVQSWYQRAKDEHGELGELVDGVRRFSDSDRAILVSYAGEKSQSKSAAPKVQIEQGNHSSALTLSVGVESSSLEQFRSDRIRQKLANPRDFVASLTGFLDQIESGMDEAEAVQEEELQQIRAVKKQASKRIENFRRRADQYRLKTDILASIQNAELEEVADLAEEINSLGKPVDSGSQSSEP